MKIDQNTVILGIEAAIGGGSLALCRGDREIASWAGTSNVSKAEDLLFNIDRMFKENGISNRELGLVAVSAGPGSFTGIRIGLATALGLKAGIGIPMSSESALKAVIYASKLSGQVAAALPVGRNSICVQRFSVGEDINELEEPHTMSEDEFLTGSAISTKVIAPPSLIEKAPAAGFVAYSGNVAVAIARICRESPGVVKPALFISKSF